MRAFSKGLKVTVDDIEKVVRNEVLKRGVLDGDKAVAAEKIVRRAQRRQQMVKGMTVAPVQAVG